MCTRQADPSASTTPKQVPLLPRSLKHGTELECFENLVGEQAETVHQAGRAEINSKKDREQLGQPPVGLLPSAAT